MSTAVVDSEAAAGAAARRSQGFLRGLVGTHAGVLACAIVGGLVMLAVLGPWIAPYGYAEQNIPDRLTGPSLAHPFGTDDLGRDVLSRAIGGIRIGFEIGVPAIALACVAGLALGLTAGYVGAWLDSVAIVVMDVLQVFPAVVLALLVLSLLGPSQLNLVIVIAVSFVPNYARVSRALVVTTKEEVFIEAERVLGAGRARIILRHLIPNVFPPILVLMAMDIPFAIVAESGLSFLGLGVQPPDPSWGAMLTEGFSWVQTSPWPVVAAGGMLAITTLGLTMLAERIKTVLDPTSAVHLTRRI